jgi:hypothetical protein
VAASAVALDFCRRVWALALGVEEPQPTKARATTRAKTTPAVLEAARPGIRKGLI